MNITEEMLKAYRLAERDVEVAGGSINAAMRAGLAAAAPLIAAQALRSVDVDRIAQAIGDPGSIVGRRILPWRDGGEDGADGETVTRWATRAVLAVVAGEPDRCCNAPNMVWEHSRAGKDHFRCAGCGGGMTKARATDA